MKWKWLLAGMLISAPLLHGIVAAYTTPGRSPVLRAARAGHDKSCGETPPLTVELVPDAVEASGGKQTILYRLDATRADKEEAAVAWTIDLASDLGEVFQNPTVGASKLEASTEAQALATVGAPMPDGYYVYSVRAALALKDGGEFTTRVRQYIVVKQGVQQEVDEEQWYKESRAREARVEPAEKEVTQ